MATLQILLSDARTIIIVDTIPLFRMRKKFVLASLRVPLKSSYAGSKQVQFGVPVQLCIVTPHRAYFYQLNLIKAEQMLKIRRAKIKLF